MWPTRTKSRYNEQSFIKTDHALLRRTLRWTTKPRVTLRLCPNIPRRISSKSAVIQQPTLSPQSRMASMLFLCFLKQLRATRQMTWSPEIWNLPLIRFVVIIQYLVPDLLLFRFPLPVLRERPGLTLPAQTMNTWRVFPSTSSETSCQLNLYQLPMTRQYSSTETLLSSLPSLALQ